MVTEIGKFLRILRVSNEESAKVMAERLGVSPAYLSAVELGKRSLPATWEDIIIREYSLNDSSQKKLRDAINRSMSSIKLNITDIGSKKRELILSMALLRMLL